MKNLIKLLTTISILSVISLSSSPIFAQKHAKKASSKNSFQSSNYSTLNSIKEAGDWKFGADFGMTLDSRSTSITGTTDPIFIMLGSLSGFSPFVNLYADYSIAKTIGLQTKVCWDYSSVSASKDVIENGVKLNTKLGAHVGTIGISFSIRYDVLQNLFFTAGPSMNFAIGNTTATTDIKILTQGKTFADGSQVARAETQESGSSKPAFGLEIGGGYRITLSNTIDLVPRATFQLFPSMGSETSFPDGGQASTSTATRFQFSCGLMIGL